LFGSNISKSNKTVSNQLKKTGVIKNLVLRQKTVNARKNVPKSGKITIQEPKKFLTDPTYWQAKRVLPAVEPLFRPYILYCISLSYKALRKLMD